jgi:hypothetical protein
MVPWLAKELEPNRKLLPHYLPSIFHGASVSAGSLRLHSGFAKRYEVTMEYWYGISVNKNRF